ncbi:ABC transporter ATP-binding protein/permease [Acidobacteria bacterium AH-259-O06]|nr:ABC transporter ATP-binding protein/permease [Acidobacteria bacterium AH-259-O06]
MNHYHEEDILGKAYDSRLARRLLKYLYPYRWTVATSIFLLLLVSGLQLVPPYLTKVAIDQYISTGDGGGLAHIALLFLLVLLFQFAVSFAQTYLMNWTGQRIMYDLRMQIFAHIQKLDMAYFDRNPIGRLITRMTTDVDVLNELFTAGVVSIFGDIFSLAGIVLVMLWLNWKLALVCFSVIPLLFIATMIFKIKVRGSYRWVRSCVAKINAFLQENITGMSVVQIFVEEKRKFHEFDERNSEHLRANLQSISYYAVFYPVVSMIGALATALILWYGGNQVLGQVLTLGSLVAFIQYSERFYKPISDLSEKFNILQSAMASSERIFRLLDTKPEIIPPAQPVRLQEIKGKIEFKNVSFAYKEDTPVLDAIDLTVIPGEKVAIVGATGAGKSTLINLLCRFYGGHTGDILIDGVDIQDLDLGLLRESIAVVLQDVFLFRGSIEENVRLWGKPISKQKVEEAARQVHAHRFVQDLAEGYATPLAERGVGLSVGQRQLLAFARALAHDPKILVLDEATSSVDTETELLIQDALNQLMKDRTCLIIAHRLSTIQNCDRIIVLHKGEIQEKGSHQELLKKRGIYYKLYQLQYKDQLIPREPADQLTG